MMKRVCSKCDAPASEFDESCHKCGHVFRNQMKHIVSKPHHYHIVRDIIILCFILLISFWVYNIYKNSQEDKIVQSPTINIPEIKIPEVPAPIVNINMSNQEEQEFKKSKQGEYLSKYYFYNQSS